MDFLGPLDKQYSGRRSGLEMVRGLRKKKNASIRFMLLVVVGIRWALFDHGCFVKEEELRIRLLWQHRAIGAASGW